MIDAMMSNSSVPSPNSVSLTTPATIRKSRPPPKWLIFIAPAVMTFLFSLYPVIVKRFANQGGAAANGYVFTFYREIGALAVLFVSAWLVEGAIPTPDLRMMIIFGILGFVGMFINQFGYITAVYIIGPDLVSVFIPTVPVWTTILSVLLCTERLPSLIYVHAWAKYFGILVAVGGAIVLTLSNIDTGVQDSSTASYAEGEAGSHNLLVVKLVGYFGMFVDTFSAALYYVLLKKLILNVPNHKWRDYPIAILAYCYSFSAVFMAVSMLYYVLTGQLSQFFIPKQVDDETDHGPTRLLHALTWGAFNHASHVPQSFVALLYAIFITSALCYFLISWSSKYLPSTVMSAYQPLQVPTTIITEYVVFGDQLTTNQYLIAVAIIAGVLCVLYSNHAEEKMFAGQTVAKLDQCCSTSELEGGTKHPYVKLTNLP